MARFSYEMDDTQMGPEALILAEDSAFPVHRWGAPTVGLLSRGHVTREEVENRAQWIVDLLNEKDIPVPLPETDHPDRVVFFEARTHDGVMGLPLFGPKVHAITMLSPHLWLLGHDPRSDFQDKDLEVKTFWGAQFATGESSKFAKDGDGWIGRSIVEETMTPVTWGHVRSRYPKVAARIEDYLAEHRHVALPAMSAEANRERLRDILGFDAPSMTP